MADSYMSSMTDEMLSTIDDMATSTLGERLREERKLQKKTLKQVGDFAGVTRQAVSQIELGSSGKPEAGTLEPICRYLGIRLRWLNTGKLPRYLSEGVESHDEWVDVEVSKQTISIKNSDAMQEYTETHKAKFRADMLTERGLTPSNLKTYYSDGDSMEPRINDGDMVMFDISDKKPKDDALFVIRLGTDAYAKRCEIIEGNVYFKSDNPKADPAWAKQKRMGSKSEPIEILGRVRWIGSWED